MADFFSRIFAISSDEDSYSSDDSYSQSSSIRRNRAKIKHKHRSRRSSLPKDASSTSVSLDEDDKKHHRRRQRRSDEPRRHRSTSHDASKKKKRSSSDRPVNSSSKNRSARAHVHTNPTNGETENYSMDEAHGKVKSSRSKFSVGMKKYLSPTSQSPLPLPSKQTKKRPDRDHSSKNIGTQEKSQPINLGDFITISQQYLEEATDMSVLTLPKELANKELNEDFVQVVGQKDGSGNNAIQKNKGRELQVQHSDIVENNLMHERVSLYTNKLLDISYSLSMENNSELCEEVVEVQDVVRHPVGKHAWPCDPTVKGYASSGEDNGVSTNVPIVQTADSPLVTDQENASNSVPRRLPPDALSNKDGNRTVRVQTPVPDDPSGIHLPSPASENTGKLKQQTIDKPSRSNKSVSFCLPPSSSHPPAPPLLGPMLDYYYSMERPLNDQQPIWSNPSILPPIVELWSSVEDGTHSYGASGMFGFGSIWNKEKENDLVGEDEPLIVPEECVQSPENQSITPMDAIDLSKMPIKTQTSQDKKSVQHFNDILNCNEDDEDAPNDEKESLKLSASSASIDPEGNIEHFNDIVNHSRDGEDAPNDKKESLKLSASSAIIDPEGNIEHFDDIFNSSRDDEDAPNDEKESLKLSASSAIIDPEGNIEHFNDIVNCSRDDEDAPNDEKESLKRCASSASIDPEGNIEHFNDIVNRSRDDEDAPNDEKESLKRCASSASIDPEGNIEHFNDIVNCSRDDEDAPNDEKESLKRCASSASIDPEGNIELGASGEDANIRHRSQWKSSHNMTYKAPMSNSSEIISQKDTTALDVRRSESSDDSVLRIRRFHDDDEVLSAKKQPHQDTTPRVILHGRVVRHVNVSPSNEKHDAISLQAAARGMLERERFLTMIKSASIIQRAARRFLCRHRYLMQLKLKLSYFPGIWKRKVLKDGF